VMPGDALIPDATDMSMQAVTVDAPAEDIRPWLVQIGYQRGGLYSYDWLDRLFGFLDRPSATRILPQFQHVNAQGDVLGASASNSVCVGSRTVRPLLPKSMRHLKSVRAMVGGKIVKLAVKHGRITVKFSKRCGLYAVVIRRGHQRFERLYTVGKAGNVTGYNVALVHP
jgi:hypothetical protein